MFLTGTGLIQNMYFTDNIGLLRRDCGAVEEGWVFDLRCDRDRFVF